MPTMILILKHNFIITNDLDIKYNYKNLLNTNKLPSRAKLNAKMTIKKTTFYLILKVIKVLLKYEGLCTEKQDNLKFTHKKSYPIKM